MQRALTVDKNAVPARIEGKIQKYYGWTWAGNIFNANETNMPIVWLCSVMETRHLLTVYTQNLVQLI